MTPARRPSTAAAAPATLVAVLGALALGLLGACSGSSGAPSGEGPSSPSLSSSPSSTLSSSPSSPSSSAPTESPSASATASAYLPVPSGVALTPPGTVLDLGERAVVAWQPRQGSVGVLQLRVARIDQTTVAKSFRGWKLSSADRRATPYFVVVTARNVGGSDLAGQPVPLYLLVDDATLIEASRFEGRFQPCPSTPLPRQVDGGAPQRLCQVYLAPAGRKPVGVSFRPGSDFQPITWSGDITKLEPAKKSGKPQQPRPGKSRTGGSGNGTG